VGQKISMTLMSGGRLFKKMVIGLMAGVILAAGSYAVVQAAGYDGTVFGLGPWVGYFDNNLDEYGDFVLINGIPGEVAPVGSVDPVGEFKAFLQEANGSGDNQRVTGSAFIVNTMLGRDGPGNGRDVSDADWNDLNLRLQDRQNKGKINWNKWVANDSDGRRINSYYQDSGDDAFYSLDRGGDGIEILDDNGNVIYTLVRACANPIGKLSPLPPPTGWSISATSTASVNGVVATNASPGNTISWSHILTDAGSATTTTVSSDIGLSGFTSAPPRVASGTTPSGSGPGIIRTITDPTYTTYVVKAGDVGYMLCEKVNYNPTDSNGGQNGSGNNSCVTISSSNPPPTDSDCRPMKIPVQDPRWSSSTDKKGNNVNVTVKVYNLTTDNQITIPQSSTVNGTDIDVTTPCTTGDKYKVELKTNNYAYNVYHCDPTRPPLCYDYRVDPVWQAIIGPCFDYNLKASIFPLSAYQVEADSVINIVPGLSSEAWTKTHEVSGFPGVGSFNFHYFTTNAHTKSKDTDWQISQLIIPPNVLVPTFNNNSSSTVEPCAYFLSNHLITGCSSIKSGKAVFSKADNPTTTVISGDNPLSPLNVTIGDHLSGTKVCFAFSVHAAASDPSNNSFTVDPQWNHSALYPNLTNNTNNNNFCTIVVKKPKVQVLGGDLSVGKSNPVNANVATTTSVKDISGNGNHVFGSWVEYAIFATGSITGMASGSAFNGGLNNSTIAKYSSLSFANSGNHLNCTGSGLDPNTIGCYSWQGHLLPDVTTSFPVTNSTTVLSSSLNLDSLTNSGVYTANGNVSIAGGNIGVGKWIVINAPTVDINITGDIKYTPDTLHSLNNIPQVVIIANNINISSAVRNIDAWLIASGTSGIITTCTEGGDNNTHINATICANPLVVNGPVMARHLYLRRTAGSGKDTASGDPAETFNLRADAYLWAYARATGSGRVQTVYTTELPPRL